MFAPLIALPLLLAGSPPGVSETASEAAPAVARAAQEPAQAERGVKKKRSPNAKKGRSRYQSRSQAARGKKAPPKTALERIQRQIQQRRRFITNRGQFFASKPATDDGRGGRDREQEETTGERPYRMEFADEAQRGKWFALADANGNGWLSFRESEHSLNFDRPRFRSYDANRDGRMAREEFETYYAEAVRRNAFATPVAPASGPDAPRRSPLQIRNAYDHDVDRMLSANEVSAVLADYDRTALPLDRVMAALDDDGDASLTVGELEGLPSLLFPVALPPAESRPLTEDRPETILELFGRAIPRGGKGSPSPPLIRGPVPHFRRLDLDNDGSISVRDLESLLRPLHVGVRIPTLVNTLDTNLDGVLSQAEFTAALGDPRSPVD